VVKLFFSILAGYAIFIGLMALQIITPLINAIDGQMGGTDRLRVVVPSWAPVPAAVAQAIDNNPVLVVRVCEGAVVVLISWSALLLLTHWSRRVRAIFQERRKARATAAARRLAAVAARKKDNWA
jgi:hypothetical protein